MDNNIKYSLDFKPVCIYLPLIRSIIASSLPFSADLALASTLFSSSVRDLSSDNKAGFSENSFFWNNNKQHIIQMICKLSYYSRLI